MRRHFLIGVIACACWFMMPACSNSPAPPAFKAGVAGPRKSGSTTPPFSTKEPERYQAIRITSVTETGSTESSPSWQTSQVIIARDGEKRREEYSAGSGGQIVHLEIPAGHFIVLPASKIYADLSTAPRDGDPGKDSDSQEFSPDRLLNEEHAPATYEMLGTETLAGRLTTKYRVVVLTGTESQSETLIWIDETLGMPVRSETISRSTGRSSKVTTELKDLKLEIDERLFSWPSDYRKVDAQRIFELTRREEKPVAPGQQQK